MSLCFFSQILKVFYILFMGEYSFNGNKIKHKEKNNSLHLTEEL